MILTVVATEPVVRHTVAAIPAALLPVTMFRLPAMRTITLPRYLLLPRLNWAALLRRSVVLLLALLVLLPSGLLLLPRGVVLLLTPLLALLILLPLDLLLLSCRIVLVLLILLSLGLLLVLL